MCGPAKMFTHLSLSIELWVVEFAPLPESPVEVQGSVVGLASFAVDWYIAIAPESTLSVYWKDTKTEFFENAIVPGSPVFA